MKEDLGLRGAHIVAARLAGQALRDVVVPAATAEESVATAGALSKEALRTSNQDTLRNAIYDYPVTYAVATSLTAALTATAIVIGGQLLTFRLRSR
jgi:hypothetical protein